MVIVTLRQDRCCHEWEMALQYSLRHKGMLSVEIFWILGIFPQIPSDDNGRAASLPVSPFLFTRVLSEVKSLDSKPITHIYEANKYFPEWRSVPGEAACNGFLIKSWVEIPPTGSWAGRKTGNCVATICPLPAVLIQGRKRKKAELSGRPQGQSIEWPWLQNSGLSQSPLTYRDPEKLGTSPHSSFIACGKSKDLFQISVDP